MRLKDQVVVVTGAGSGIGRASAKEFAKEGARIVVADINLRGAAEPGTMSSSITRPFSSTRRSKTPPLRNGTTRSL